ncbi:hypothetical protein ACFLQY_02860 [Verrucomicrobiota bacterium]
MLMKHGYTFLLASLLAAFSAGAKEPDPARLKRIKRRFGKLVKVEESRATGVPELPREPELEEEEEGWSLFGRTDETLTAPQPQRRVVRRAPRTNKKEAEWGWLHAEVVKEQEKREAKRSALTEASRLSADEARRSSFMSEADIQREVALRLKQQPSLLTSKEDPYKPNPLKQLPQYRAMGKDYRSPAQKMLSPEYTQSRLNQFKKKEKKPSSFSTSTFSSQQQPSVPYGKTQTATGTGTQRRSIRDLRKLPSLRQDPFAEQFPKVRRSIWDD